MPHWVAVRAVLHHERLAYESVASAGFETFTPKVRARVGSVWRTTPMFGIYFFARIVDQWRAIERSLGVLDVVKVGAIPAKCPDQEIARLLERSDADGIVRLGPRTPQPIRRAFAPGAAVSVSSGPFAGFDGIHTGMSTREREIVLLDILGALRPVEIAAGAVAPRSKGASP